MCLTRPLSLGAPSLWIASRACKRCILLVPLPLSIPDSFQSMRSLFFLFIEDHFFWCSGGWCNCFSISTSGPANKLFQLRYPKLLTSNSFIIIFRPGSSVGIATDYGLDALGSNPGRDEIFRLSRPPLGPNQPPVKWVPVLSRG